jgi:trimethylamine:corrinoid methyltransferase-like protein
MHQACLDILQNTGVRLHEQEAIGLLRDAGCSVEDGILVRIPPTWSSTRSRAPPRNVCSWASSRSRATKICSSIIAPFRSNQSV